MNWRQLAKPYQLPPQGEWSEWVMSGGRGAGKTRTGVEWLIEEALSLPGETLAIIAPTLDETRIIDFHGIAGLLSNVPYVAVERYRKSALTLELTNGARIVGLSADRPEEWRGRVFARVLCEERQAWPVRADEDDSQAVFEAQQRLDEQVLNLLRVPGAKRMVTMTPVPTTLCHSLLASKPGRVITTATTFDNVEHLNPQFVAKAAELFGEGGPQLTGALPTS